MRAWKAGDRKSGNLLFRRHFAAVYRFFRSKVGLFAEDLTQRTFLGCVEALDRIRGDAGFRAYLFAVARNQLLMHFRRTGRSAGEATFESWSIVDLGGSPGGLAAQREEQRVLLLGMQKLPVDYQIALELHYWEDMSTEEIAVVLGVARGTIKARLSRGREMLKKQLAELVDHDKLLESTVGELDKWVRSLSKCVPHLAEA